MPSAKNTAGNFVFNFAESPKEIIIEKNKEFLKNYELDCEKYGFDCNYSIQSSDINIVIMEFQKHTLENHFIEYPEGVLMRFIMNKRIQLFDI